MSANILKFEPKKKIEPERHPNAFPEKEGNLDEYERFFEQFKFQRPRNRAQFLKLCKTTLLGDTYEEVLCSILDTDYYDFSSKYVKKIVDAYYEYNV
jgi:hypothetical protein